MRSVTLSCGLFMRGAIFNVSEQLLAEIDPQLGLYRLKDNIPLAIQKPQRLIPANNSQGIISVVLF